MRDECKSQYMDRDGDRYRDCSEDEDILIKVKIVM